MKNYLPFLMCFITFTLWAQNNLEDINLEYGKHEVGFLHYNAIDSSRTYRIRNAYNNESIHRPIPVSIWYPGKGIEAGSETMQVIDYLNILKEEEEWEHLPNEFLMDWFSHLWNTEHNKAQLYKKAYAQKGLEALKGKFPVIVYAPSYQASSIENFALCEYLASHGYIVISSPSRGTDTRWLDGATTRDMETQSGDIAFLIKAAQKLKHADADKTALMGFSFGGLSNFITAIKNSTVKAVVSLDGSERYNYPVLEGSPFFFPDRFDIPYVHFAQKEIPVEVLQNDGLPADINDRFQLLDVLPYSDVQSYRFHDLTHAYFSTLGVLFTNRDKRQDKSDDKIAASYGLLCQHALQFFNATVLQDEKALKFIQNSPAENGYPENLLSKRIKKANPQPFDYLDFNDLAIANQFENLIPLYQNTKAKHPELELHERMLNTWGLWLSFDPEKGRQGIKVFELALHIYPESANLYDSMAEGYRSIGDTEKALAGFRKSLELDPQNDNAKRKIALLEKE